MDIYHAPPYYIGTGQYIAYQGYFACRDERKEMWRLSTVKMIGTKGMEFNYIGEFQDRVSVINYINTH